MNEILAETRCRAEGWSFAEVFAGQYLITRDGAPGLAGWRRLKLGAWVLQHCPRLPVTRIKLTGGQIAGAVIGYAIAPDGAVLDDLWQPDLALKDPDLADRLERMIEALAGRYTVLISLKGRERVYPDPACALGPVYHAEAGRVAASTTLALDRPIQDTPEVPAERLASGASRLLFGLTRDAEVRRMRPNHYLDLAQMTERRHWPRDDTPLVAEDTRQPELTDAIAAKLGQNMRALIGRFPTALPITGGSDSRLLLAGARDVLDRVDRFYIYQTNWANAHDCVLAQALAERLSLPLQVIARKAPRVARALEAEALDRVCAQRVLRNGDERDTSDPRSFRAMELVPAEALILRGNVAEMTRALRWHPRVFDDPHDTAFALAKLEVRPETAGALYPMWQQRFLAWKAALPRHALPRIYDFLHCELWLPHTNSVVYMADTRHVMINPFNDRALIHMTLQISPKMRRNRRVIRRIMRRVLPEAKDIQFTVDYVRDQLTEETTVSAPVMPVRAAE